ncbi:MAG: hypothetical protein P8Y60_14340 [Calditrichota bacterium]
MWQAWITFLSGLWIIFSGIVSGLTTSANAIIFGIVIAILSFWVARRWQGVVNGIIGLWLLLSGIVVSLSVAVNFIIVGIVVAILALWLALSGSETA